MEVTVIGSGPAGVAVSKGLLAQGCKVTMLDAGNVLDPERKALINEIKDNIKSYKHPMLRSFANGKDRPKLSYGSNFVYDDVDQFFNIKTLKGYFRPSLAQGGLSNVWGAALASYDENDLEAWPKSIRNLSAHYEVIKQWFGKYFCKNNPNILSQQAHYIKNIFQNNERDLHDSGFKCEIPDLAVNFNDCMFCGSCQHGCPKALIYQSTLHLNELIENVNFTYRSDCVVERFEENNNSVTIYLRDKSSNQLKKNKAERVYVAAGSCISTLLYLRSVNQVGVTLSLNESQHFIVPCLINKDFNNVSQELLHTLCQLKFKISNQQLTNKVAYIQLYTYMDFYQQEVMSKLRGLSGIAAPLLKKYMNRLIALQGFLHNDDSNCLTVQYEQNDLFVISEDRRRNIKRIKNVVNYINNNKQLLGFNPLKWLTRYSLTGQSNHLVGSIKMSEMPSEHETNIWGQTNTFKRIHFVDGSILPSMPAGPITWTIMANAYRIGKEGPL